MVSCRAHRRGLTAHGGKSTLHFKAQVDAIRGARAEEKETGRPAVPDFETFCREWLKQPLAIHQLRMLDVLEGRELARIASVDEL